MSKNQMSISAFGTFGAFMAHLWTLWDISLCPFWDMILWLITFSPCPVCRVYVGFLWALWRRFIGSAFWPFIASGLLSFYDFPSTGLDPGSTCDGTFGTIMARLPSSVRLLLSTRNHPKYFLKYHKDSLLYHTSVSILKNPVNLVDPARGGQACQK